MNKKDKELLLKDICSRLPYGVKARYGELDVEIEKVELNGDVFYRCDYEHYGYVSSYLIKPYLRHPSDMTEKEVKELVKIQISKYGSGSDYNNIISIDRIYTTLDRHSWSVWLRYKRKDGDIVETCFIVGRVNWETTLAEIDYLNSIHVDYRGMIENDLAYRAPEGMYNLNKK